MKEKTNKMTHEDIFNISKMDKEKSSCNSYIIKELEKFKFIFNNLYSKIYGHREVLLKINSLASTKDGASPIELISSMDIDKLIGKSNVSKEYMNNIMGLFAELGLVIKLDAEDFLDSVYENDKIVLNNDIEFFMFPRYSEDIFKTANKIAKESNTYISSSYIENIEGLSAYGKEILYSIEKASILSDRNNINYFILKDCVKKLDTTSHTYIVDKFLPDFEEICQKFNIKAFYSMPRIVFSVLPIANKVPVEFKDAIISYETIGAGFKTYSEKTFEEYLKTSNEIYIDINIGIAMSLIKEAKKNIEKAILEVEKLINNGIISIDKEQHFSIVLNI